MTTLAAFVRRDALNWFSYRMTVLWHFGSTLVTVASLYFFWISLKDAGADLVAGYNNSYVEFLLTSMVFLDLWAAAFLLPSSLRESQQLGTLESLMLSSSGLFTVLFCSGVFPTLVKLTRVAALAALAVFGMGLWHSANVPGLLLVLGAGFVCFLCIAGLLTAAVLIFKQFEPINAAYGLVNAALAGIIFPTTVLPDWAVLLAQVLPLTHAMEGVRLALIGAPLETLLPRLVALTVIAAVLIPTTLVTVSLALHRAKVEGSLVQY